MSIVYKYIGLPTYWSALSVEDIEVSSLKFTKILEAVDKISDKPVQVICIGQIAPVVNYIINKEGLKSVRGLDFTEYFNATFDKDKSVEVPNAKFVILYNVGLEKALNLQFSKQILQGIIQKIRDNDNHLFLQSNCTLTKLRQDYGVDFQSCINLQEKQKIKVI